MFNFICFGSGSCGNCYYLFTEDGGILIDCGIGPRLLKKHFANYGLSLAKIKAIFVTHEHADHVKSVGTVANSLKIPVYTTSIIHKGILENYVVATKPDAELFHDTEIGDEVDVAGFKVHSFPVPHDSRQCVGYEIDYKDIVFCLITDAGHVTEEMLRHISRANYLVIEANYDAEMLERGRYPQHLKQRIASDTGHLCNKVTAEVLLKQGFERLRHVWLCHLSEENNHPELARKTVQSYIESIGYRVGKDVQLDVLKRRVPSEVFRLDRD